LVSVALHEALLFEQQKRRRSPSPPFPGLPIKAHLTLDFFFVSSFLIGGCKSCPQGGYFLFSFFEKFHFSHSYFHPPGTFCKFFFFFSPNSVGYSPSDTNARDRKLVPSPPPPVPHPPFSFFVCSLFLAGQFAKCGWIYDLFPLPFSPLSLADRPPLGCSA